MLRCDEVDEASTFVLHDGRRRGGAALGGGEADLGPAGPLPRRSPSPAGFKGDHDALLKVVFSPV